MSDNIVFMMVENQFTTYKDITEFIDFKTDHQKLLVCSDPTYLAHNPNTDTVIFVTDTTLYTKQIAENILKNFKDMII